MKIFHKRSRVAGVICVVGALLFATVAQADEQASQTCAAELTPTGKAIFEAVAPTVNADSDLKKLIEKKVRPLVLKGELKRKDAKANAPAAGKCLHLLQQEKSTSGQ